MDFNSIDWNALWQEESKGAYWKDNLSHKELWDRRADKYGKSIGRGQDGENRDKDDYVTKMLERIEVRPGWTVLDIGCGPGTLALSLAKKAGSVTALDISSEMLKRFKIHADKAGLVNIQYLNLSWQDAFAGGQLDSHDVVVASRSLMADDMNKAVSNLARLTRQAAYLTLPIVNLPFDWEVHQAIGRRKKHPPYIYIYNMLYRMGIPANVEILNSKVKVQFTSVEEAIEDLQWRTDPFGPDELERLREFLENKFAQQGDSAVFTHEGRSKWALIWWRKEE